jgi:hypothetical protein
MKRCMNTPSITEALRQRGSRATPLNKVCVNIVSVVLVPSESLVRYLGLNNSFAVSLCSGCEKEGSAETTLPGSSMPLLSQESVNVSARIALGMSTEKSSMHIAFIMNSTTLTKHVFSSLFLLGSTLLTSRAPAT